MVPQSGLGVAESSRLQNDGIWPPGRCIVRADGHSANANTLYSDG